MAVVSLVKLPSDECHWTLQMMSQHVQVMAWCRQATSHYLRQCWLISMSPHGVTTSQWVKQWRNIPFASTHPLSKVWPIYDLAKQGILTQAMHLIEGGCFFFPPQPLGMLNFLPMNSLHAKFSSRNMYTISIIPPHWHDTGSWNSPSCKIRTYLVYTVNIIAADGPGDTRSQGISNPDIDLIKPGYLGPCTQRVINIFSILLPLTMKKGHVGTNKSIIIYSRNA